MVSATPYVDVSVIKTPHYLCCFLLLWGLWFWVWLADFYALLITPIKLTLYSVIINKHKQ